MVVAQPWKNASTLIVLARNQLSQSAQQNGSFVYGQFKFDYKCMLLKRAATSKFFAKAFVFPGGATEPADFSPSWLDHFARNGFDRQKLTSQLVVPQSAKLPLYTDSSLPAGSLPQVGFRISAIRETFEETGVLVCKSADPSDKEDPINKISDLEKWQKRVYNNPSEFLLLCQEHRLIPDVWSLFEWSNWLTPEHMGPKRYDTIFYVCMLDHPPKVRIDGKEITEVRWSDPVQSIWDYVQGTTWLAPPQIYELSRMANFPSADELKSFATKRQGHGMERWLPIGRKATSGPAGFMTVLPGDSLYGSATAEQEELNFETSGKQQNRMGFVSPVHSRLACNIDDPHGHPRPINLIDIMKADDHKPSSNL